MLLDQIVVGMAGTIVFLLIVVFGQWQLIQEYKRDERILKNISDAYRDRVLEVGELIHEEQRKNKKRKYSQN